MDSKPICHPSPANKMKCFFWIVFTSDDQPGCLMDSNPICHPSPANKMKCSFLDDIHFGWSARLVNGLKPHQPPLSKQKNEMLIFWLCSTSDDWPGWSMDSKKKWNAHFWITFNFWCWPDLSIDSNPIHHPSPAKKMKCSFLDYIHHLMIGRAGEWTQTPFTTHLQPIKWNPYFCITLNFWWSAGLVNGLKPHLPPLSSQKSEMLIFLLQSTSDLGQTGQWTQTPSTTHLQPIKWNACFCITLNFWWLARLSDGLKPHLPPLSSQKNEMLIFGFC